VTRLPLLAFLLVVIWSLWPVWPHFLYGPGGCVQAFDGSSAQWVCPTK
jgi:hypothetical protein